MSRLFPVPFAPGMDQSTDPAFMAPGQLTRVENLRPTRNGRLAKRPGFEEVDLGAGVIDNFLEHVAGWNVMASSGRFYTQVANGFPAEIGRLPLGTPVSQRDIHELPAPAQGEAAELEIYGVAQLYDADADLLIVAYEATDGITVRAIELSTGNPRYSSGLAFSSFRGPFALLQDVDGAVYLVASDSIFGLRLVKFDFSSFPVIPSVPALLQFTSSVNAVSMSAVTGASMPGEFVICFLDSSGDIYVRRYDFATGTQQWNVLYATGVAPSLGSSKVDIAIDATHVYAVHTQSLTGTARCLVATQAGSVVGGSAADITWTGASSYNTPHISCLPGVAGAYIVVSATRVTGGSQLCRAMHVAPDKTRTFLGEEALVLTPLSRIFAGPNGQLLFVGAPPGTVPRAQARLYEIDSTARPQVFSHLVFDGTVFVDSRSYGHADVLDVGDENLIWAQRVVLRRDQTVAGSVGMQNALRSWRFSLNRTGKRQIFEANGVGVIPGGELTEWDGERLAESGFLGEPRILAVSGNTSGNLTPGGSYQYSMVWERVDGAGRIHRSAPSDPVTLNLASNENGATIFGHTATATRHRAPHTAHLYRTLANGSVFYRASTFRDGYTSSNNTDGTSDADLALRQLLYTEGGVLPYDSAPASTFGVVALGRIWLGGLFKSNRVVCSTELFPGEAPGFPNDGTHQLDFAAPVTGLAALDDTLVVFSQRDIWIVSGDGPSITGAGGFSAPRRLSTDLGCVDWRSVLTTSIGVFYQSRAGLMLLPRGGVIPEYVGRAIADEQEAYPEVIDAALHGEGDSAVARFLLSDGGNTQVVAFALRARAWSVDTYTSALGAVSVSRLGTLLRNGVLAPALASSGLTIVETPGVSSARYLPSKIITGEIAPFGFGVRFRLKRLWLRATNRGPCDLTLAILYDDQPPGAATDYLEIDLSSVVSGTPVIREWTPRQQGCRSIRFEISDKQNGAPWSQGVDYLGLTLEVEAEGPQQLPAMHRS